MHPLHGIVPTALEPGRPGRDAAPDMEVLRGERHGAGERTYARALAVRADADAIWQQQRPRAQWEQIATGPWRAGAGLAFAAQLLAQERESQSPGLHVEDYPPALLAYGRAALPVPRSEPPVLGLPVWV